MGIKFFELGKANNTLFLFNKNKKNERTFEDRCILTITNKLTRLKITDSRSPVMMTGQIFFSPDKPRFWPVKLMNIIIIFLPMEYRITLAVDRCTALSFRFLPASWYKKFIHTLLSSFPRFSPVLCPFIISSVSSYGGIGSFQGSSYICISVKSAISPNSFEGDFHNPLTSRISM